MRPHYPLLLLLCVLLLPLYALADEDVQIDEVGVHLELTGGYVGGETMAQLEQALLQVTEVALLDQLGGSLNYIANNTEQVEASLSAVIESVLTKRGFTLQGLTLQPGVVSKLTVRLALTEERVDGFEVRFILLGNTPVIETVVEEDEAVVAAELYTTVARTPYGDAQWLSRLVRETVEANLAGMTAYRDFDQLVLVQPGQVTKVAVTMTPKSNAALVCDYDLQTRSGTLPQLTLDPVRDEALYYLQSMVGAPMSFIDAKLFELEDALFQYLVNCGALSGYCADAGMSLELCDCELLARIDVDSEQYMLAVQGRVDLIKHGEGTRNARLSITAGVQPVRDWVVYTDIDYFPGASEAYGMLGGGKLLERGFVGAGWDFKADTWRFQGRHDISDDVYVSADLYKGGNHDGLSELAIHYRLRQAYELQLITNLNGEVYAALAANL